VGNWTRVLWSQWTVWRVVRRHHCDGKRARNHIYGWCHSGRLNAASEKKKSMKINHFEPEGLDTIGITFTNSSRNYAYVEIHNLDVE
jgi:hypothetical protein